MTELNELFGFMERSTHVYHYKYSLFDISIALQTVQLLRLKMSMLGLFKSKNQMVNTRQKILISVPVIVVFLLITSVDFATQTALNGLHFNYIAFHVSISQIKSNKTNDFIEKFSFEIALMLL
jgi:hypothetical protein